MDLVFSGRVAMGGGGASSSSSSSIVAGEVCNGETATVWRERGGGDVVGRNGKGRGRKENDEGWGRSCIVHFFLAVKKLHMY